jgi:hypothetical protein
MYGRSDRYDEVVVSRSNLLKRRQAQLAYGVVVPSAIEDAVSSCEVECGSVRLQREVVLVRCPMQVDN